MKRVIESASRCIACKGEFEEPVPKIILHVILADSTSQLYCNSFSEEAEILLGKTAQEVI